MLDLIGAQALLDPKDFLKLAIRLLFDLSVATILIRAIYYRVHRRRDMVFVYYLFNIITFCLCHLLRKVPIELGFALGLFAVFDPSLPNGADSTRDLTYLFVIIGIGILNAVANKKVSVAELCLVNFTILGATWYLENIALGGGRTVEVLFTTTSA